METGRDEIAVVLMEPMPVSRRKTKYRSLRRQVYFFQSISVLFCVTCCLFTAMYASYPAACKENGMLEAPKIAMHHQAPESNSSEEMTEEQAPFIRLTVKNDTFAKQGHVPWMYNGYQPYNEYFTLDEDLESLMILRDGMYKVSLQITYRGIEKYDYPCTLQQDIINYSVGYGGQPLPLLTYLETVNFTSPPWIKSLFSEGIFYLEKGDRLKVWTNSLLLIDVGEKVSQKTVFLVYPHFST
ncbi:uncharacterized protein si:ch211-158d24.4 [Pseudorasbora parva]|uniref:uncharacterized protein si:ch211-158d24.4 n=1 Tax=Pseudorasbora parva TaxID=51549 RepID=UPI00351F51AA